MDTTDRKQKIFHLFHLIPFFTGCYEVYILMDIFIGIGFVMVYPDWEAEMDRTVGWTLIGSVASCFLYYTVWVIILPFVDDEQTVHQYFPDPMLATAVPLMAGVVGLGLIGGFVTLTLLKSPLKEKYS